MRRAGWIAALVLMLGASAAVSAQRAFDLVSSHAGAVTDLAYDGERDLLVSAGEDGTIRVWDAGRATPVAVLRVSYRPIQRIALHPSLPQVAAQVAGRVGGEIVVWDWQARARLYSLEFKEQVLSLRYSPGGSYLIATRADFDSLVLLDPQTGRALFYMRKGFGIVSFAVVSRNENTILTYQPSGIITYWDIKSGRTLKQVRTLADLSHVALSPNLRFAAGSYAGRLAVVDLVTGERIDERQVPGLAALAFSPQGNELTGVVQTAAGAELRQWYFGGRFLLQLTPPWGSRVTGEPQTVVYGQGRVYAGARDGSLQALMADGSVELLARHALLSYSDAAVLGDTVALAGDERIYLLESSFLTDRVAMGPGGGPRDPVPVGLRTLPNPLSAFPSAGPPGGPRGGPPSGGTGLEFLSSDALLVWARGEEWPRVGVLELPSGRFELLPVEIASPIKQVSAYSRGIVIVDEGGTCLVLDPFSFQPRFRYSSPGMNKVVFAVGDTLVGGRASLSTFGSPLLQINERTGETVAISDPGVFVYDLLFEPREGALFTHSVEGGGETGRTLLKVHSGYGFERSRVLAEYRGEDLSAGLARDDAGRVYSSLGYERVVVWNGEGLQRLEEARQVHRDLFTVGDKVMAVNRDGSLSFWDSPSRRLLLTLYVLQDLTWVAVLPDERVYRPQE
ncbi:MAG: hypothetical protein JW820_08880 [Spirochaetales bacterium]|nr:hypothetical protein [Spirochaetales bacterium]